MKRAPRMRDKTKGVGGATDGGPYWGCGRVRDREGRGESVGGGEGGEKHLAAVLLFAVGSRGCERESRGWEVLLMATLDGGVDGRVTQPDVQRVRGD